MISIVTVAVITFPDFPRRISHVPCDFSRRSRGQFGDGPICAQGNRDGGLGPDILKSFGDEGDRELRIRIFWVESSARRRTDHGVTTAHSERERCKPIRVCRHR